MPPPLNSVYKKVTVAGDSAYTVKFADDVVTGTITTGRTWTLPAAGTCTPMSGQNVKQLVSGAASVGNVTIAVPAGSFLIGVGAVEPGQAVLVESDGTATWTGFGGGGAAGVSGFSGPSGYSGFSGPSGFSGFSGISGFSGFTGISGASGFSGFTGASGYSGFSGFSGISGYSGNSGTSGFSG